MSDANLERITILLQARDRDFARAMDRNNKLIARLSRDGQRDMVRLQRSVNSRLDDMASSAMSFGRNFAAGLAGGAVATAFGMLTTNLRQTIRGIASVGDEARRAGVGVEAFQQWSFVAEQNRISIDAMTDGLKEMSLRADEFIATGAGAGAEAFRRLGYDSQSLALALEDPSEMLLEIFGRLERFDTAAQIRIADEVFGGTGGEQFVQLIEQGEEGLRRTMQRAEEVGAVMEESMIQRAELLDQKFTELTTTVGNFLRTAAVGLFAGGVETSTEALERLFGSVERARAVLGDDVFSALTQDMRELTGDASIAATRMAGVFDSVRARITRLAADMSDVTGQLSDLGRVDELLAFDSVIAGLEQLVAELDSGRINADQFETALADTMRQAVTTLVELSAIDGLDLSGAVEAVGLLQGALTTARAEARALRGELPGATGEMTEGTPLENVVLPQDMLGGRRAEAPPRAPNMLEPPATGTAGGGGGGSGGWAGAVADIEARTRALNLEAASLVAVAAGGREYGMAAEYAAERARLMQEAMEAGREITPALQAEIDALAESYITAAHSAEEARTALDRVRADAERGADAITSIFEAMTQGGDAARAAIARLLQQMASNLFQRALMGMTGGGGGFLSVIGGLLGKRAAGGPVQAGTPYLVNENTPNSEVFVPSRSGGILNVAQAKDALRGGSGGGMVEFVVRVDQNGNLQAFVERTTGRVMAQARPAIIRDAVGATHRSFAEVRPQ